MICKGCGCFFCVDSADQLGGERKLYCNRECYQKVKKRRRKAREHLDAVDRVSSCEGKQLRFATEREALGRLDFINSNSPEPGLRRAYLCGYCQGWHLTRRAAWVPAHDDLASALADLAAAFPPEHG